MPEFKGTPGPWANAQMQNELFNVHYNRPDGSGWYRVAVVQHPAPYHQSSSHYYPPVHEVEHNARLIAAAPDLLAALLAVKQFGSHSTTDDGTSTDYLVEQAIKKALQPPTLEE